MNCGRFEKLLALDSGGDLGPRDRRRLAEHLRACDACRRAGRDFAATRELLLSAQEPPEFDDAFFTSVRRNVLRELDARPPRPGLAALLRRAFAPRALAYAAAAAVLVAVGLLGLILRGGRTDDAGRAAADESTTRPAQRETANAATSDDGAEDVPKPPAVAPSPAERVPAPRKRRQSAAGSRAAGAAGEVANGFDGRRLPTLPLARDRNLNAVALPAAGEVRPGAAPGVVETASAGTDDERKMLRIELQTSDPNVRIIWLTPQVSGTAHDRK